MERNDVGYWMIACVVVVVVVAFLTGILVSSMPGSRSNTASTTAFAEVVWNWLARAVGMTTVVVGILLLLSGGLKSASWQYMARHVVLILIGLLVVNHSWAIAVGIALVMALLAVADILKSRRGGVSVGQAEASTAE